MRATRSFFTCAQRTVSRSTCQLILIRGTGLSRSSCTSHKAAARAELVSGPHGVDAILTSLKAALRPATPPAALVGADGQDAKKPEGAADTPAGSDQGEDDDDGPMEISLGRMLEDLP